MTPEILAWIERQKPALVGLAEGFLIQHRIYAPAPSEAHKQRPPARVSGSQLRTLLNAAQSGSPVAVLVNLLHYQVGRGARGWDDKASGDALAVLLRDSVSALVKASGANGDGVFEVEARVSALLLGFVIREYTYCCKREGTNP